MDTFVEIIIIIGLIFDMINDRRIWKRMDNLEDWLMILLKAHGWNQDAWIKFKEEMDRKEK